jgi:hypothetical protein
MSAKLTNEGENHVLDVYLAGDVRDPLYLGLYTDGTEPAETANLDSITELVEGANGYDRIALPDANWTIVDDVATHEQQTFTANGASWGNVTGYFICDAANGNVGNLIFVEHFSDGPYLCLDGLSILVTPAIQAS